MVPIRSGLFRATPNNVVVLPVLYEGQVKAVIELGSVGSFTDLQMSFLEQLTAGIGIVLNSIEATMQTEGLLKQSQQLGHANCRPGSANCSRPTSSWSRRRSSLPNRTSRWSARTRKSSRRARALEEKAAELALTSKYKSEFLANMSHELRTPLNSILILGQQLGDNPDGNLTPRQVEFARTIHGAGTDLLNLISDILDLSKIESGTMSVDAEEILLPNLQETVTRPFRHEAESRGLSFNVQVDPALRGITTDSKRLQQVLKNLLSNAFKFTEHGGVQLSITAVTGGWTAGHPILDHAPTVVAFEVSDTGIGIQPEKQRIIFEAFQQADASTSRKYGGTGLGLAISRELSNLLGGEIQLRSKPGVGSTFTLYLPLAYIGPATAGRAAGIEAAPRADVALPTPVRLAERPQRDGGRRSPQHRAGDTVLLIVEDDPHYARVLVDLAHDHGLKVLVAMRGADALTLAREYQPTAVSLDVFLPDMLGWTVLSQLKQNPATRHIPVQIVTLDEDRQHGLARGAFSFMTKPTTTEGLQEALGKITDYVKPRRKQLLVVEDNAAERLSITELLGHDDIDIITVETGGEAIDAAAREPGGLRGARPASAGHVRLRGAGTHPRR